MFKNVKKEEIAIPAQMSYMGQVRDFIEHIGVKYKYSDKIINSYKLVIEESCTNIIRHGYRDIKGGEISIKAIIRQQSLTVVITDQGISYDPRQAQTPDLEKYIQIGKKGGLGIFMMRKLMDDVHYNITSRGNELRLTKQRDHVDVPIIRGMWEKLSMHTRYTIAASVIISIIAAMTFTLLYSQINDNILEETFEYGQAQTLLMADNCKEWILAEDDLELFTVSSFPKKNNPNLIYETFIVNTNTKILASGTVRKAAGNFIYPDDRIVIQDTLEHFKIYQYTAPDSSEIYDLVANIYLEDRGISPVIGQAHIWITFDYIESRASSEKFNILLLVLVLLVISFIGTYFLIGRIVTPFRSLTDWVRQVGQGTVDEDEIDIDSSDELGEIAQAFNMMTNKFREAQVSVIEQQRLQKELQVAQEIQQMLLPSDFPNVKGYDLASFYEAAKEVGGDLFDFIEVDKDTIGICVADVAGKGVPGSLIMTMIRTALRLEARGNKNPADVLSRVNRFVTDDMKRGMFVTMFYLVLDSRNRIIHYASAGHNPMILYRGSTKQTYFLNPSGFPVGIQLPDISLFENRIEQDSIRLREDDMLVLYTDGITEAMNPKRELYREERFLDAIRKNSNYDVSEFANRIKDDIKSHTQGYPQNDDITYVAVKEKLMQGEVIFSIQKELFRLIEEDGAKVKDACEKMQVSPYMYRKYKKIKDDVGLEGLKELLYSDDYIEKRHMSIEVKTLLFDVIRNHPEFGAKRISAELNTEKYSYTKLDSRRVYDELVKAKLNTKEKRENHIKRGGKKRIKAPGTPLLTLDGQVILDYESAEKVIADKTGVKLPGEMMPSIPEIPIKRTERQFSTTPPKEDEDKIKEEIQKEPVREITAVEERAKSEEKSIKPDEAAEQKEKKDEFVELPVVAKKPEIEIAEPEKIESKKKDSDKKRTDIAEGLEPVTDISEKEIVDGSKSISKVDKEIEKKIDKVGAVSLEDYQKLRAEKEEALKNLEEEKKKVDEILKSKPTQVDGSGANAPIPQAVEEVKRKLKITTFEVPQKKIAPEKIEAFYDNVADQIREIKNIVDKWTNSGYKKVDLLKIGKALGEISTSSRLKSLGQIEQLFVQVIRYFEYMETNDGKFSEKMITQNSKDMLKYIEKENILSNSSRILERINELGIKNHQLREKSHVKSLENDSQLESIRRKIAKKNVIKNEAILNNMAKTNRG